MPFHLDRSNLAIALEIALIACGLCLLWRVVLSPRARAGVQPSLLAPWDGNGSDLLGYLISVILGVIAVSFAARVLLQRYFWDETHRLLIGGVAFQLGLLAGIAAFHFAWKPLGSGLRAEPARTLAYGFVSFLLVLPAVYAATIAWQSLLGALGVPVENQDTVKLFEGLHSWPLRVVFSLLAIVVAPFTEEMIFRAGLFRFFRGRMPHWLAVVASSVLFGACHLIQSPIENLPEFLPLVVLGCILSVAYERTGRIGTTIVAHALFNLNTIVILLAGLNV